MIQYQILRNSLQRNVWSSVRRIGFQILGVKGLIFDKCINDTLSYSKMQELSIVHLHVYKHTGFFKNTREVLNAVSVNNILYIKIAR